MFKTTSLLFSIISDRNFPRSSSSEAPHRGCLAFRSPHIMTFVFPRISEIVAALTSALGGRYKFTIVSYVPLVWIFIANPSTSEGMPSTKYFISFSINVATPPPLVSFLHFISLK